MLCNVFERASVLILTRQSRGLGRRQSQSSKMSEPRCAWCCGMEPWKLQVLAGASVVCHARAGLPCHWNPRCTWASWRCTGVPGSLPTVWHGRQPCRWRRCGWVCACACEHLLPSKIVWVTSLAQVSCEKKRTPMPSLVNTSSEMQNAFFFATITSSAPLSPAGRPESLVQTHAACTWAVCSSGPHYITP